MKEHCEGFPEGFEKAIALVDAGACSLAVFVDGEVKATVDGRGVAPLLDLFDASPEILRGAVVADKIIGKAAAMILALAGASAVYGAVMSESGREYLTSRGISAAFGIRAERIVNRSGDGLCPVEKSVLGEDDAAVGIKKIRQRLAELKSGK